MEKVDGRKDGKGGSPLGKFAEEGEGKDNGVVADGNEQGSEEKKHNSQKRRGWRGR
jgi:hypothetical protein